MTDPCRRVGATLVVGSLALLMVGSIIHGMARAEIEYVGPVVEATKATVPPVDVVVEAEVGDEVAPEPTPQPTLAPSPEPTPEYRYTGRGLVGPVSFYSHAGCVGCSPHQITASGEPFDENALTLAVSPGALPMGTMVRVTNLSTGLSVVAKVNDTGGFAKYGRVADLSLATYQAIGARTDVDMIMIEVVE